MWYCVSPRRNLLVPRGAQWKRPRAWGPRGHVRAASNNDNWAEGFELYITGNAFDLLYSVTTCSRPAHYTLITLTPFDRIILLMIGWSVCFEPVKVRLLWCFIHVLSTPVIEWAYDWLVSLFWTSESEAVVLQPCAFDVCNRTSHMHDCFKSITNPSWSSGTGWPKKIRTQTFGSHSVKTVKNWRNKLHFKIWTLTLNMSKY